MKGWKSTFKRIFKHPKQINNKHHHTVSLVGRAGFLTKSFIYASIAALTLKSAFTEEVTNESPQGVFILFGSFPNGSGHILLISLLAGVCIYALWRFWEGLSGQGYDANFSKKKNFFRYRLSPLASGIVYILYACYIVYLFTVKRAPVGKSFQTEGTCFPLCWRNTMLGKSGLGLLSIAFTIATITQLIPSFTGNFRNEIDFTKFNGRLKYLRGPFMLSGRIGFFGRALFFFLICFFFWEILLGSNLKLDPRQSTFGQAVSNIQTTNWGKAIMVILGLGLLIYSIFAFLCIFFKIFPTPPPSSNTTTTTTRDELPLHNLNSTA